MAYEIELKAHVKAEELERVKSALMGIPGSEYHGQNTKFDIYWSTTDDGEPVFRTRRELTEDGPNVLFTAKPVKKKDMDGTEENEELEYSVPDAQWDDILQFYSGIGLQICRLKWKKGFDYRFALDGFNIHAELLNVRFLGWFIEMEICLDTLEGVDREAAYAALHNALAITGVPESEIEPIGYNKLLKAIGHEKG